MTIKTRIETLHNVPQRKLDIEVNTKLNQIERDGMSITDIQYFPRDITHPGQGAMRPEYTRTFDVVIQWVFAEK